MTENFMTNEEALKKLSKLKKLRIVSIIVGIVLILISISLMVIAIKGFKLDNQKNSYIVSLSDVKNANLEKGKYLIYLQTEGMVNGRYTNGVSDLSNLKFDINCDKGKISVHSSSVKASLSIGTQSFESIAEFEADEDGVYDIKISSSKGNDRANFLVQRSNKIIHNVLSIIISVFMMIAGIGQMVAAVTYTMIESSKIKNKFNVI